MYITPRGFEFSWDDEDEEEGSMICAQCGVAAAMERNFFSSLSATSRAREEGGEGSSGNDTPPLDEEGPSPGLPSGLPWKTSLEKQTPKPLKLLLVNP